MDKKKHSHIEKKLKNKVVLITGGSGSVGSELTKKILKYSVKSLRVLDVDEHSLFKLKRNVNDVRLRPLLGSITDLERLEMAGNNVDIIIHAAAVKNIEVTEFNPIETIETNTIGTVNMIKMAIKCKPEIFLNISTDKAAEPSTLYGTTKQLGERLTSWAGVHILSSKFASVRFGNVIESRGNVFEVWKEQKKNDLPLTITDPEMKRYFFHVDDAVEFILEAMLLAQRGEIFVPKMKLVKISNLAKKISNNHKIVGVRQGEKMTEILLTNFEKKIAKERNNMWVIHYYKQNSS